MSTDEHAVILEALSGKLLVNSHRCVTPSGVPLAVSALSSIVVAGTAADERVIVRLIGGSILPASGTLTVDLGDGTDSFRLLGTAGADSYSAGTYEGAHYLSLDTGASLDVRVDGAESMVVALSDGADRFDARGMSNKTFGRLRSVLGSVALSPLSIPLVLRGGPGNDVMSSGAGDDTLYGDEGDDTVINPAGDDGSDLFDGGAGTDVMDYSLRTTPVIVTTTSGANDGISGEADDVQSNVESVVGGAGDDTLTGSTGPNILLGASGNDLLAGGLAGDCATDRDTLNGGAGDDTFSMGSVSDCADTVVGGAGTDIVDYGSRATDLTVTIDGSANDGEAAEGDNVGRDVEVLLGGAGDDRLTGGTGADELHGGPGDDVLAGLAGNDTLVGNLGDDTLNGGTGDDVFLESGTDSFYVGAPARGAGDDILNGGPPTTTTRDDEDRADYSERTAALTITLCVDTSAVEGPSHSADAACSDDDGEAGEADSVINIEWLFGGSAADTLSGGSTAEYISGGSGDDTIDGGNGDDTLDGGDGSDTAIGGGGHDHAFSSETYAGVEERSDSCEPVVETCNSRDDDCDGSIDEGALVTYYDDDDGDTYGDSGDTTTGCSAPTGYVANSTDCNDASASVNPGASETCNTVDDDCDGSTDEGVTTTYYDDDDGDTHGDATDTAAACSLPVGYVATGDDCDDTNAGVYNTCPVASLTLAVESGSLSTIAADRNATTILRGRALSAGGGGVAGATLTLVIPTVGGTSSSSTVVTDASGYGDFTITSSPVPGTYAFTITSGGFTSNSTSLTYSASSPCAIGGRTAASPFAAGDGSSTDPYLICTSTQWNEISTSYATQYFAIGQDIDFSGVTITRIGSSGTPFTGKVYGTTRTLSNISGTLSSSNRGVLFDYVGAGAYLYDFTVNNVSLTHSGAGTCVGGLVGNAVGSAMTSNSTKVRMHDVTLSGAVSLSVSGTVTGVGALFGCTSYTEIGADASTLVTINASSGSVTAGAGADVGGAVGSIAAQTNLNYVASNLTISAGGQVVGGLIGRSTNPSTAAYCSFTGTNVTGAAYTGGFVGYGVGLTVTYSYVRSATTTTVVGTGPVGGFAGYAGTYSDCYSRTGTVQSTSNSGDISGFCGSGCAVTRTYSTASFLDTSSAGVGAGSYNSTATDTIARSDVQVDANDNGTADGADVSGTYRGGAVIASSAQMTKRSLFASMNFNFSTTWRMPDSGGNDDYPILQWETSGYTVPTVSSLFAGGSGTVGDPWQIATAEQLGDVVVALQLDSSTNDDYYVLTGDIDMSGQPAPSTGTSTTPFRGSFDGASHTVSNLAADWASSSNRGGLFGYLGAGAYLHDFTVDDLTVSHTGSSVTCIGGLVGNSVGSAMTNDGTKVRFHDVTLSGAVSLSASGTVTGVGALFGCTSYTEIGADASTLVTINASSGSLTASAGADVGGAVGTIAAQTNLNYVTSNLTISAGGQVVGGLIGRSASPSTAAYCSFTGTNVTGAAYTGGFVGYGAGLTVTYSYVRSPTTTTVVGTAPVGGFAANQGTYSDCYSRTSTVQSTSNSGDVSGFCGTGCTVARSYSTVSFLDTSSAGVGAGSYSSTVTDTIARSDVQVDANNDGSADGADVSLTYPGGAVVATSAQMTKRALYTSRSFNFGTTWRMPDSSVNDDYPILQWETPGYTVPTVSSLFAGGSGTVGDPWQVSTAEQLADIAFAFQLDSSTNDDYYTLTGDIDMSAVPAPSIGTSTTAFRGGFDGASHTVSNLAGKWTRSNQGTLFGYVGAGAYVHDVTVENVSVSTLGTGLSCVGGVIGNSVGSAMTNDTTKVRLHDITLSGTFSSSFASAVTYVGGLVGCISYTEVGGGSDTPVTVNVSSGTLSGGASDWLGGVVGFVSLTSTLTYVSGNLNVSTSGSGAGGVLGYSSGTTTASYSAFVGTSVSAANQVGGFVGAGNSLTATYSYVRASSPITLTSSGGNVGGFTGQLGTYTDCYSRVETIAMTANGSGVGGFSGNGGTLTRVYSTVAFIDTTSTGIGASGYNATVTDTIARSDVQVDADNNGSADGVDVSATYPGGAVIGTSAQMTKRSLYTSSNFDFGTTWRIPDGAVNDDYPILQWETPGYTVPTVSSLFAGGSGTMGAPWEVSSAEQLANIGFALQLDSSTNNDYYTLTGDIDMSAIPAPSIGTSTTAFRGSFDGASHTVSNLVGKWARSSNHGALFGYLGAGAYVHDVTVENVSVSTLGTSLTCLGGVIGNSVGSGMGDDTTKVRLHDITLSGTFASSFVNAASLVGGLVGCISYTEIGGGSPLLLSTCRLGRSAGEPRTGLEAWWVLSTRRRRSLT